MKRYDRYFFGVFTQSLLLVLALFTVVFLVVDVLLNLEKFRNFDEVSRGALMFYGFNLPPILYLLYPFAIFAAGMFALGRVIRARELLLLEASGVSPRRALAAIMIPCLLLGFAGLALRQFALPDLSQAARESPYGAFEFRKGRRITVRDDTGNVWFVRRYNLDSRTLEDVRILDSKGTRLLVAPQLTWVEDKRIWWTAGADLHDLAALTEPASAADAVVKVDGTLPFGKLYPADFARRKRGYSDRSLLELWYESEAGDNLDLRQALWHELWYPFGGFILLACGVGLIVGRGSRGAIRSGALALGCVVAYQVSQFWFETLAQSGAFPPAVGASITPIIFSMIGVWVWLRV